MNPIDKLENYFDEHIIKHEGVSILDGAPGRGSGRYPLGSGKNPNQHIDKDFLARYRDLKKQGMKDPQIAEIMGVYGPSMYGKEPKPSSTRLRTQVQLAVHQERIEKADRAVELYKQGYNPTQIARMMGFNSESSVRNLLNEDRKSRTERSMVTADLLKEMVDKYGKENADGYGMVDVGAHVETQLNIPRSRLDEALYILELEGYPTYGVGMDQHPGYNSNRTNMKVLCTPGTPHKAAYNYDDVHSVLDYDKVIVEDPKDGSDKIVPAFQYPSSMDSKRIMVRYAEEGGKERDGTVEIRRGVPDLYLGGSNYSQVRILVDGTHYVKGMALYGDDKDFPPGVDLIFNTNKTKGTALMVSKEEENAGKDQVLKRIKKDPDNPFGSYIKPGIGEHRGQSLYIDPKDGKEKLSLINKRSDEGDWNEWGEEVPSQFLAKQNADLIKRQINISIADKKAEFEDIMALENPTVKRKLLAEFANKCDGNSVSLKAAALPRAKYQVLMPLTTLKKGECFAPNYENGEKVALIRFPHEGTFQIPILTVNNKNREGLKKYGSNAKDVVAVLAESAEKLSGADFDGDTVQVVPLSDKIKITSRDTLKGLDGFDTKSYRYHTKKEDASGNVHYFRYGEEFTPISKKYQQKQMGMASNLITDMTLRDATEDELARAVRCSMTIIDAEKHGLDWQSCLKENKINELKKKYQEGVNSKGETKYGGASTLISLAKNTANVPKREGSPRVNLPDKPWYDPSRPEGALIWKTASDAKLYYTKTDKKTGKVTTHMHEEKIPKMTLTDDAHTLSSGLPVEEIYADYANELKHLANRARVEEHKAGNLQFSPEAKVTYAEEVKRLEAALRVANANKPRERQALREANAITERKRKLWKAEGKSFNEVKDDLSKEHQRALTAARVKYGSHRTPIDISPREWEAIQAGAIHDSKLQEILNNADMDVVRKYATPKGKTTEIPNYKKQLIKLRAKNGYTNEEIAKSLGISVSSVQKYL